MASFNWGKTLCFCVKINSVLDGGVEDPLALVCRISRVGKGCAMDPVSRTEMPLNNRVFIVFDGIYGAGKTTHLDLVEQVLKAHEISCKRIKDPGGCETSDKIRSLLLSQSFSNLSQLLMFSAARYESMRHVGNFPGILLSDRFWDSTYAYQGLHTEKWVIDSLFKAAPVRIPEHVFLFLHQYESKNLNHYDTFSSKNLEVLGSLFKRQVLTPFGTKYHFVPCGSTGFVHNWLLLSLSRILQIKLTSLKF